MSLVSIIIPCYNYGWLLAETLNSLLAQTHQGWECIVVDDGSMDNTRLIVEAYQVQDARFRYVHQVNAGMSSARNTGIQHAGGTYLQFLDADDLLTPRKLELQAAWLDSHHNVDIVYGDVRYFEHGKPSVLSRSFNMQNLAWACELSGQGAAVLGPLVAQNQLVVNAPLLRASLLDKVGLFSEHLRSMEDWEFWLRCALAGAFFHYDDHPDTWALVRVHSSSLSQNHQRMMTYVGKVREQLIPLLKSHGDESITVRNQELLESARLENAVHNIQRGNVLAGIAGFLKVANSTGRYWYYTSSIFYWLRRRQTRA